MGGIFCLASKVVRKMVVKGKMKFIVSSPSLSIASAGLEDIFITEEEISPLQA